MSDMYAIKDTTLTALGDAVRSKVIGTSEIPVINDAIRLGNSSDSLTAMENYSLNAAKIKVKLTITYEQSNGHPLYIVPGVFDTALNARNSSDKIAINKLGETGSGCVYENTFNINAITIVTQYGSGLTPADIEVELIGLDENGNEFKYTPLEMADIINTLKTIPSAASTITGDCQYKFSANGWNWFIDTMGDELKTNDVTSCAYMFSNSSNLKHIPFDINVDKNFSTATYCFSGCNALEEVPYIVGPADRTLPTSSYSGCIVLNYLFQSCQFLRYIPEDYFWKIIPNEEYWAKWRELSTQSCNSVFQNCYSLRKLPDISMLGAKESYYSALYNNMCYQCFNLDEITNLPVAQSTSFTSNAFSSIVQSCYRLKDFIFATNEDGTAKTAPWKGQTIDLSKVGYGYAQYNLQQAYNSGITEATRVNDDATYQALKDDPDYFTHDVNYSRYNHDSAVNTINSLPDCSATGTNTIKFTGAAGALTDGGAINTLTEAEIAVAAAKGWTVSLV